MSNASGQPAVTRRPRIASQKRNPRPGRAPHVITITSGKGGVGKTHLTANLGWQLRQIRRRVLILDADLSLANIDIILGLTPDFNLSHVINGEMRLADILTRGPGGVRVLPASSGVTSVNDLTDPQKIRLLEEMETLEESFDFLLIDTAAGIAGNVIYFSLAAQTIIVVLTPEPTSLTDAYALIKVLANQYHQNRFRVIANEVSGEEEGLAVYEKLTRVTDRFLNVSLDYLGCVPFDPSVREAVCRQRPFCEINPEGPAALAMRSLARRVASLEHDPMNSDLGVLWRNVLVRPTGAQ